MDPKPMRLSDRDREDLRGYFVDAISSVAGHRAQRYEAAIVGGVPDYDLTPGQERAAAQFRKVDAVRANLVEFGEGEHWGVLSAAFGPLAADDHAIELARVRAANQVREEQRSRGKGGHEQTHAVEAHLAPLLRLTDALTSESVRLWIFDERSRLLECARASGFNRNGLGGATADVLALDMALMCLPPSAGSTRWHATLVLTGKSVDHEARALSSTAAERKLLSAEWCALMNEARAQSTSMLFAAEHAYRVASREVHAARRAA